VGARIIEIKFRDCFEGIWAKFLMKISFFS
jgi:hypothetical protein